MPSNFLVNDSIMGQVDLDDYYITDQWFLDNYGESTLFVMGRNDWGGLGDNTVISKSSPIQVGSLTNWTFVNGNYSRFAVKSNGTLWSWGFNSSGQLGIGKGDRVHRSSPTQIGALTTWKEAKEYSSNQQLIETVAAIKTDGTLWTWGADSFGLLANGLAPSGTSVLSPVQIGTDTSWYSLGLGVEAPHALSIKTNGTLWSWGGNTNGQLGLGDLTHRSAPTQLGTLANWKQFAIGGFGNGTSALGLSCAIKTDGTIWAWGNNTNGQLGLGNVVHRSSPTQIGSLTNWKQVAAISYTAIAAIKTDGTLWTWGLNSAGQLGSGTITNRSSPVQVGTLTNWKMVDHISHDTGSSVGAIKTDGTLWAWGNNFYGELGDGTVINKSSPIQVGTLTNWKQVFAAGFLTYEDY